MNSAAKQLSPDGICVFSAYRSITQTHQSKALYRWCPRLHEVQNKIAYLSVTGWFFYRARRQAGWLAIAMLLLLRHPYSKYLNPNTAVVLINLIRRKMPPPCQRKRRVVICREVKIFEAVYRQWPKWSWICRTSCTKTLHAATYVMQDKLAFQIAAPHWCGV